LWPLLATLTIQTTNAALTRTIPTIAPVFTLETGLSPTAVGWLSAVSTLGSIAFLVMGTPLLRREGPIRALQIGLLLAALGTATLAMPWAMAAVAGSFLIGLGYGPSAPAGSDILQRTAPAKHRNLIFSIKQAGVPIGGILAGLALPPLVEAYGWRAALVAGVAVAVATALAVQGSRARIDTTRDHDQRLGARDFLAIDNIRRPLRALAAVPELPPLVVASMCFAVGQGAWFAFLVTMCVAELHLTLVEAGLVFAAMQATGVGGRILLGWVSDRLGSGRRVLEAVAVGSGLTSLVLATAGPAWPFWAVILLAGVAGITVSSWNGVQIAEVARPAPHDKVAETTSGATIVVFIGYVVGPAGFATIAALTGRFDVGYLAVAATAAVAFLALRRAKARPA
jgi:MFS family permease